MQISKTIKSKSNILNTSKISVIIKLACCVFIKIYEMYTAKYLKVFENTHI